MCGTEYDKFRYYFNVIEKSKQAYFDARGNDE